MLETYDLFGSAFGKLQGLSQHTKLGCSRLDPSISVYCTTQTKTMNIVITEQQLATVPWKMQQQSRVYMSYRRTHNAKKTYNA